MSKTALKKELQTLTKEQLITHILDLYSSQKAVKEFYNYYLNPDSEQELFEKYKKVIEYEFYPTGKHTQPKTRFSACKKAIADFRVLKPSPKLLADLMLFFAENACQFTHDYGDMSEQYYDSAVTNYVAALKYIAKNNFLPDFQQRTAQCVQWASPCGYGFSDEIDAIYSEYYNN